MGPYKESLDNFVTALARNMKDDDSKNGCKDTAHPAGRTTSFFTFASIMNATFYNNSLAHIPAAIGPNGKFTLALPIAASCHEYEQYVPMHGDGCGPACQMFDANKDQGITMDQYVQAGMDVVTDPKWGDLFQIVECGQFIGLSFWTWTYDMTYPPMKWFNNVFLPPTPSSKTLTILKTELPKLQRNKYALK